MSLMEERRKTPRADVDEMAYISSSGSSTRCRIANMSEAGAALDVPDAAFIPNCFHLMTERDRIVRSCRIVWTKQNRIGVEFDRALEEQSPITHRERQYSREDAYGVSPRCGDCQRIVKQTPVRCLDRFVLKRRNTLTNS